MKLHRPTLGRLLYLGWHRPKNFVKRCAQEGPINLWLMGRGRRMMERAAGRLSPLPKYDATSPMTVHYLTGQNFWYQTLFCAYSLLKHAATPLRIHIVDDGSLRPQDIATFRQILPAVEVETSDEILKRLDHTLPITRFPSLRARRLIYPHLRKLTDVHAGQSGWRLVLDSDMLFHHRPAELLRWLHDQERPIYMLDVENAYGYSMQLMQELTMHPIPNRVNVGVCGLQSEAINWERLEHWCKVLLEREGSHYLQEQALTAMLVAGQDCEILLEKDYIVRPTRSETQSPHAAMHHYVAESKAWYFRHGWKHTFKNDTYCDASN